MRHGMTAMVTAGAFMGVGVPIPRGVRGVLVGIRAAPQFGGGHMECQAQMADQDQQDDEHSQGSPSRRDQGPSPFAGSTQERFAAAHGWTITKSPLLRELAREPAATG